MSNVKCWNYGRSDHYWRDCRAVRWSGDTGGRAGDARSRPLREKPCRVFQEEHGQEAKERGRPMGVPAPEVDVEAQPGAAEAERRERRLARDSAECYCLRDEQVEANDALNDEVGALLTEECWSKIRTGPIH